MTIYIERDCVIEHEGRKFESGGAVVTPDHIVAYLGAKCVDDTGRPYAHGNLTDWHGNVIGTYVIRSTWKTPRSFVSSDMHQVFATVNGANYTGRSAGIGMIFKGRRVAKQRA